VSEEWFKAKLTFLKPYMASSEGEDDHPILFDPGDKFFVEVREQPDHWEVVFLDQAFPLEWYDVNKDLVEVKPAQYFVGKVKFVQQFALDTPKGVVLIPEDQVISGAGIVDDGGDKIDLLLEFGCSPDRIPGVPRDHLLITDAVVED
jgi:hypothetical protein